MGLDDGIGLINRAYEKDREDRAFQLYSMKYMWMSKDNFVPFEKFYDPKQAAQVEQKSESQILSEVKEILDSYKRGEE